MLLHVVDPEPYTAAVDIIGPDLTLTPAEMLAKAEHKGWQFLNGCLASARSKQATDAVIVAGRPADDISRVAREWKADLVVVGSHGRQGLERIILGSVAEKVMREAACPVLIVKENRQKKARKTKTAGRPN
jgi:nucleotide-binding universal stress UspA family protein